MSVYVDPLVDWGWILRGRRVESCHMFADTEEELHEMASRIGMRRSWFQDHAKLPHYDLVASKRDQALELGAVGVSMRFCGCFQLVRMIGSIKAAGNRLTRKQASRLEMAKARIDREINTGEIP